MIGLKTNQAGRVEIQCLNLLLLIIRHIAVFYLA